VPAPPAHQSLRHGDQIRLGQFRCTFRLDEGEGEANDEESLSVASALDSKSSALVLQAQPAEQLRILLEISNDLSHTLDLAALLPQILDHLMRLFPRADRGFVLLSEQPGSLPVVRAFKARRAEHESNDRVSSCILRRCVERVEAFRANNPREEFASSDSVVGSSVQSLLCAPLWAQDGRALGAIQLDSSALGSQFTEADLRLLLGVAGQASVAIVGVRLHREALARRERERDLAVARDIQLALLPRSLPVVPGYAFHTHYHAAQEVGGDYYDFVPLPAGRLAVLVGDVAGKGIPAALVMARFSAEARVCLETEPDLGAAVSRLNDQMVRADLAERFVTLAAVVLDPAAHTLTVASAGHPLPLVYRAAGGPVEEVAPLTSSGPPLGCFPRQTYEARDVRMGPGDGLVLFSDGVTEAMNAGGQMLGPSGVRAALGGRGQTAQTAGERLLRAVQDHAAGCEQSDDIVLVCVGRLG
jgi:serine phosphatase RsbU (regulator of sigma subunit)